MFLYDDYEKSAGVGKFFKEVKEGIKSSEAGEKASKAIEDMKAKVKESKKGKSSSHYADPDKNDYTAETLAAAAVVGTPTYYGLKKDKNGIKIKKIKRK